MSIFDYQIDSLTVEDVIILASVMFAVFFGVSHGLALASVRGWFGK